jgi:hypothetical protein
MEDLPVESGFTASIREEGLDATALAALVSVADDVTTAFNASRAALPPFRAIVSVTKTDGASARPPHRLASSGEAVDIAGKVRDAIRSARAQYPPIETVHLFMAVPAGLAMLIGQLLNTLVVHTYELVGDRYEPAVVLRA